PNFGDFVLLSRPHGPDLEAAVEHFSKFWRFCSTFGSAHHNFEPVGKQKSHILTGFCLLSDPRALNFDQPVDKNQTFLTVFVYFRDRAPRFWISR
ncbi:hypothetical protein, partial [Ligilactobacillus ruminis]|uniref:hypothetical protein n=1 Tax=Ligilactobacillus ruminis TaxID=1623 RepID=UPI001C65EF43